MVICIICKEIFFANKLLMMMSFGSVLSVKISYMRFAQIQGEPSEYISVHEFRYFHSWSFSCNYTNLSSHVEFIENGFLLYSPTKLLRRCSSHSPIAKLAFLSQICHYCHYLNLLVANLTLFYFILISNSTLVKAKCEYIKFCIVSRGIGTRTHRLDPNINGSTGPVSECPPESVRHFYVSFSSDSPYPTAW
jgi:hypothetical protein